ncbi:MAG: VOC family protein, partial [Chloroflexota bacterium]|nr:VOC family protein [Chloroflexota bacterium]
MPNPAPAPREFWHVGYKRIALEVDDMEKAVQYLKSKDVKITVPPANLGNSLRAEITDPDGLSIELREWFKK